MKIPDFTVFSNLLTGQQKKYYTLSATVDMRITFSVFPRSFAALCRNFQLIFRRSQENPYYARDHKKSDNKTSNTTK